MTHRETTTFSSEVKIIFPDQKALLNSPLEILNWMIHVKYTRKEFDQCKILAEEELKRSNNYNEYANVILGNIYKEEGEIQKSLKYFKRCNQLNPQNVEYLKQIGRCLFLLGRYKLALEILFKANELTDAADWNIYHHIGVCYLRMKEEDKAKEYLKQAVATGRSEKSFSELTKLYENQKDYVNAINTYQDGLRLYPSSTNLSVNLGLIYMKIEDYRNAFNQLGCALAHDTINADALFTFAAEFQRHGEYDAAVTKYKLAAQKMPESAEMWNNIGMCFFGQRKYVAAITCLKRSFYLNPMNWLTSYNLGLLHLNTKQYASAALSLSSAAKLNSLHGPTFTLLALKKVMNRYDHHDPGYPIPYRQSRLPWRRGTSMADSSGHDYDVRSMLSSHHTSRDAKEHHRWDRRPVPHNHERRTNHLSRNMQTSQNGHFHRHGSPIRQYSYTPRESDYEKPEPSVRREYSPQKRERSRDGSFKGFTTPFPGTEEELEEDRQRRYPTEKERTPPLKRYPFHLTNTPNENYHDEHRYRSHISRNPREHLCIDDYPPEPARRMLDNNIKNEMRGPPEPRYAVSEAASSIVSRKRPPMYGGHGYERSWEELSNYECEPGDQNVQQSKLDQSALSPKTFQRECQRAYHEARNQRMRNLEEVALKQLGDDVNCKRCFEEALKRNENDAEACINYAFFLYGINEKSESLKYYSHFQQLLNIAPNISKELIHMGISLAEALQTSNEAGDGKAATYTGTDKNNDDEVVAVDSTSRSSSSPSSGNYDEHNVDVSSAPPFLTTSNEIDPDEDLV